MRKFLVLPVLFGFALMSCATSMRAANPRGLEQYGYPYVLKTVNFQPGNAVTVTVPDAVTSGPAAGEATFSIPADAFSMPVTFQILAGTNSSWDSQVTSRLKVVANFAYLVTDPATGAIVRKFDHPVTYSVTDSMITKDSVYWATTAADPAKLINANKASMISGTTLEHPTGVSMVGWIITTPKSEISMAPAAKMSGY